MTELSTVHTLDIVPSRPAEVDDSRRRLELAVEGAKLGVWTYDLRTGRTWYSDRSKQMYGLEPDVEMTAEVIRACVHPDHWEEVSRPYLAGYIEGKVEVEYRVICPDGSIRWVYSLGAANLDEHGVPQTVTGIHLDITERKQAEAELEETRRQHELAVRGAKLGSWTMDPRTGATWYSERSRELWGVEVDLHLDARTLRDYIHPDDWAKVLEPYELGFPTDSIAFEHRVVWPNGEVKWVQSLGTALRDENGEVYVVHGIHLDITDRKRAEEALKQSHNALHQSEKLAALGSLLAGVSHELNNPLAAIVGQAEMLQEDSVGTPFEARARKISAAAERCARIVQTFLAMARQRDAQRSVIDINELVTSALEITDYSLRTTGVSVRANLGAALPPVEGDSDQLHQVLANLIINAQHAMEDGELFEKTLSVRTSLGPSGQVVIDITDTGPGVPDKVKGRIFEPFFTTKPQGQGTGVGLSFSEGIIQAHGGALTLEPSRRGAHFRITLPACAKGELVAVPIDPEIAAARDKSARARALVVEDEPDVAETLSELLEREGYSVTHASDGAAALMAIDREDFDLVLSDLRMPGISGVELYERLSEVSPEILPRMAFVTGDTLGSSVADFLKTSGRPVLEKPFTRMGVHCLIAALKPEGEPK
ncbi:MAG TPA: PAS domain-containing protein [Allosphingosinicella sp.]